MWYIVIIDANGIWYPHMFIDTGLPNMRSQWATLEKNLIYLPCRARGRPKYNTAVEKLIQLRLLKHIRYMHVQVWTERPDNLLSTMIQLPRDIPNKIYEELAKKGEMKRKRFCFTERVGWQNAKAIKRPDFSNRKFSSWRKAQRWSLVLASCYGSFFSNVLYHGYKSQIRDSMIFCTLSTSNTCYSIIVSALCQCCETPEIDEFFRQC
jgi:hypothetical protein